MIDLRSDTVTRPTDAMRQAMAEAEVGDDVYGEDPTVNHLEERVAEMLGKEAGLFVPSGTMANQICLHVLTDPGDEVILDRSSHIFNYESGASGMLSGVQLHPLDGDAGRLSADQVRAAVRPEMAVYPRTAVVSLENTANKAGGRTYSLDRVEDIAEVVREHGLAFHLDGARLWNASVATQTPEAHFAAPFDTVWVALSKGLGAPVGSIVAGSAELIDRARRVRKQFGGGMRQSGVLAAAALVGLDGYRARLADDHAKARRFAETIDALPGFSIDLGGVETNIVIFHVDGGPAQPIIDALAEADVYVTPFGPSTIRATTHRDVSDGDVDVAIRTLHELFGSE